MVKDFQTILLSATDVEKCCEELFGKLISANKAPFAIDLLFMDEFEQLDTPEYIKEGLVWLDRILNPEKYENDKH